MDGKTIIILLDAFRENYIHKDRTPFLYSLKQKHKTSIVKPEFGFCERTEILHNRGPSNGGFFTAIALKIKPSAIRLLLGSLLLKLKTENKFIFVNKVFRKLLALVFSFLNLKIPIYNIPLSEIGLWKFTEDEFDLTDTKFFPGGFLDLVSKSKKISFKHFTSLNSKMEVKDDFERLFKSILELATNDIAFVYFGLTDWLGHLYGPNSKEFNSFLTKLDQKLEDWYLEVKKNKINVVLLGDHGMMDVEHNFNIISFLVTLLKSKGYKYYKDYILFTDSTICRIYFLNSIKPEDDINIKGLINSESDFKVWDKPNYIDQEYGDLIVLAKPGILFYPNNFNTSELKGMHGYMSDNIDNKGMLFCDFDIKPYEKEIELKNVTKYIIESL